MDRPVPGAGLSGAGRRHGVRDAACDRCAASEIGAYYTVGDDFTVPERTVSVGGQTVTASSTVVLPDGSATKNTRLTLTQAGLYTVKYAAAGYADEETFRVRNKAFGVASSDSSARYETVERVFPTSPGYADSQFNKAGVMVRLAQGDAVTVAQVIDVGSLTKDDVLIGLAAMPDEVGKCDFERFELVLTDALDPSVSLRISVNGYPDEGLTYPFSYVRAGGQNQPRKGYEGGKQLIHVENNWGCGVTHSFYGMYDTTAAGFDAGYNNPETDQIVKLRYDAQEVALYATTQNFVMDFDDPAYFDELWHGFPSGKARLTISAANYSAPTANFLITEVYGVDLSGLTFYDEEKPVIETEGGETLPTAAVGLPYRVPAASAYDYYGCRGVQTAVYYNYNTQNPLRIDCADGTFTPDTAGWYAVVYTAADYYGNEQPLVRWVLAEAPEATAGARRRDGDTRRAGHAGYAARLYGRGRQRSVGGDRYGERRHADRRLHKLTVPAAVGGAVDHHVHRPRLRGTDGYGDRDAYDVSGRNPAVHRRAGAACGVRFGRLVPAARPCTPTTIRLARTRGCWPK